MSTGLEFGTEPTTPPPDPDKPYLWIGGQWVLIAMDTTDGVPESLDDLDEDDQRSYTRADAVPCKTPVYDLAQGPGGAVLCEVCGNTRAAHKRGGVRHLAGQHDQKKHGGGGGTATLARASLSDEQAAELVTKLQEPDGGFTIDPRTGKVVTSGYAVAMFPERSKEVAVRDITAADLKSYVDNNRAVLDSEGNMFGAWHDPETGIAWLDVSKVLPSKTAAIDMAKKQNQIAIFDFSTFESVPTGGTGRNLYLWSQRAGMSAVERQVVVVGDNCKVCQANRDPKRVPVHPHCNCRVVTAQIEVGLDTPTMDALERFIRSNGPAFDNLSLHPDTAIVLDFDDFRFDDLQKWFDRLGSSYEAAEVIAVVVEDDGELRAQLDVASDVAGLFTERRIWVMLASLLAPGKG